MGEKAGELAGEEAGGKGRWQGLSMPVSVLKYVRTSTLNFDGVADSRGLHLLLLPLFRAFLITPSSSTRSLVN